MSPAPPQKAVFIAVMTMMADSVMCVWLAMLAHNNHLFDNLFHNHMILLFRNPPPGPIIQGVRRYR
ncbi:MAG: hypothetical protein ACREBU_02625, partial [Nitrososphaera sp.]